MPNQRMTSGIKARCGILRTICSVESKIRSERRDSPLARPSAKPKLPPITSPTIARQKLTQMLRGSSPLSVACQPAAITALGAGRTRAGITPATDKASQTTIMPTGNAHCVSFSDCRVTAASAVMHPQDCAVWRRGNWVLAMVSPNGPVLTLVAAGRTGAASGSNGNTSSAKR